jgi:hypothetical protein
VDLRFFFEKKVYLLSCPQCNLPFTNSTDYVKKWISIQQNDCEDDFIKYTLKDLTAGFVGITDIPSILYIGELVELYPDAIVICTTRDKNEWCKSLVATRKNASFWWVNALFLPMPTLRLFGRWRESIGVR